MAPQNSNLVGRLKKLLDNEVTHVGRPKLTLPESQNPREETAPAPANTKHAEKKSPV